MRYELKYTELIFEIINSERFKNGLEIINTSYPNLKQEALIRNLILEELNSRFLSAGITNLKAFAEHPRVKGTRIDLSIVDVDTIESPFKIEFKYQFSKDCNNMKDYWKVVDRDFEVRVSDLFILIISDWDVQEKSYFDSQWGITSNLSRYVSKKTDWKANIIQNFKRFEKAQLKECETISVKNPYRTQYYFYLLSR
ncbi:hypothetical protein MVI27_10075 [Chryseobacterium salipaludis]|nr:hypothetical protein [Chryseobacterium salipaludis]MCJ8498606.1 hypothetical protein [Chryseobacterium salipaludis]